MPSTYTLISSNVLSSSAASVTFSAIPSTYTDLVLRMSIRNTSASGWNRSTIRFNGDTATNYSRTLLTGGWDGSSIIAESGRTSNDTSLSMPLEDSSVASIWASDEVYIPNYTVAQNKPISNFSVAEANSTSTSNWLIEVTSGLWRNTAAINTILLTCAGGSYTSGSSFYLYGIKNS